MTCPVPQGSPAGVPVGALTLPSGRLQGRDAFECALRQAFEAAAQQGWSAWWWVDADFADWPLGEQATLAALNAWACSGRRLHLLARNFRLVQARHPRFVTWRRTWDHLIEARACPSVPTEDMPSGMWTPQWALSRLNTVDCVTVCGADAAWRVRVHQPMAEAWSRATPSFPASTLGL